MKGSNLPKLLYLVLTPRLNQPIVSSAVSFSPQKTNSFYFSFLAKVSLALVIYCDATDIFFGSPSSHIERPFLDD